MSSNFLDNSKLFRHLVEDLPVGIYIVDQERQIRFWNHGAERLTGYLSHDVVGHVLEDAVQICDRRGNPLTGESCPVTRTLNQRKGQQCNAFCLHKNIEMTVTAEDLLIELLESEKGTLFDSGSSSLNNSGQEMLELLAAELGKVPNRVSVERHADAKPFAGSGN